MLLCPSLMCANYGQLASSTAELDAAGADIFHCDIMDGSFVPNFAMGLEDVKAVRAATTKPVDVHLMIENPASKVGLFIDAGANIVYIHPESERYVVKTLAAIQERGAAAGIAINPDTPVAAVSEMLNVADYVMVMTVNPGFAGQKFIEFTANKVAQLAKLREQAPSELRYKIMIDGACSPERVKSLSTLGADGFVLGTSALFGKGLPYEQCFKKLRASELY